MDYPWISVTSSNIEAISLDNDVLKVRFHTGREYHYENVTADMFREIRDAASVGRTFNALIKSNPEEYPYRQVA